MPSDELTERLVSIRRKRQRARLGEGTPRQRTTVAELEAIEARIGTTLPSEYRRFVTEIVNGGDGGMFSVQAAIEDAPEWTGDLATPFCYGNADARGVLERRAAGDRFYSLEQPNDDGCPQGCLLLAHTGCGCFDILVVSGEQRGTVWFHDVQRLFPLVYRGQPMTFLDWYETWIDSALQQLRDAV